MSIKMPFAQKKEKCLITLLVASFQISAHRFPSSFPGIKGNLKPCGSSLLFFFSVILCFYFYFLILAQEREWSIWNWCFVLLVTQLRKVWSPVHLNLPHESLFIFSRNHFFQIIGYLVFSHCPLSHSFFVLREKEYSCSH